jgi:hypothetical protein
VRWLFIRSKFWLQKTIYQPLASEDLSILRQAVRLELNLNYLVPRLCRSVWEPSVLQALPALPAVFVSREAEPRQRILVFINGLAS